MNKVFMLDTCICSYIMREHPESVLRALQSEVSQMNRIVISAITYAEMRFGAIGKKASPKHNHLVDAFLQRLDGVLPWGREAVEATTLIKKALGEAGTPIGANDTAIAGHAIATQSILVTNNTREFERVEGLVFEDWVA
jgi:tRNA(fMet)-specific endonuclease VapC